MDKKTFERLLFGLTRRKPFRPFTVELENGEKVEVDHPEAIVIRAGVAVFLDNQGVPSWFNHESVSRFIGAKGKGKAS